MKILTWNVQWCRGIDGRVDPARIVAEARRIADFDVLCLQEVADNFPDPRLAGNDARDQFAAIAGLLPGFEPVPGVAVDHPGEAGRRRRFGNMILSRLPVRQVFRWLLPHPLQPNTPWMARIAVEAVIAARQRAAQVDALRRIYADGHAHASEGRVITDDGGTFQTFVRPRATVICGDFNLEHTSDLHARMIAPFDDGTPALARRSASTA